MFWVKNIDIWFYNITKLWITHSVSLSFFFILYCHVTHKNIYLLNPSMFVTAIWFLKSLHHVRTTHTHTHTRTHNFIPYFRYPRDSWWDTSALDCFHFIHTSSHFDPLRSFQYILATLYTFLCSLSLPSFLLTASPPVLIFLFLSVLLISLSLRHCCVSVINLC